jgi:DNA polymerase-3 subunit beta
MLAQTSFAVSHDESRFALNGVLFMLQPKEARFVATDGHRLAVATRSVGQGLSGVTGIVPRKAVTEILRVLGASEDVQVAITENQFVLQMPNFVMTARLIEGQFPNWEAVLPRAHPGRLTVKRAALAAALRRVSVMAEERNKLVRLTLAPGSLTLAAASHDVGEAEEVLEVDYTGGEVAIGFNARYILDALGPMDREDVIFEFKDGLSPGLLRSAGDDRYSCVIMPMRI